MVFGRGRPNIKGFGGSKPSGGKGRGREEIVGSSMRVFKKEVLPKLAIGLSLENAKQAESLIVEGINKGFFGQLELQQFGNLPPAQKIEMLQAATAQKDPSFALKQMIRKFYQKKR